MDNMDFAQNNTMLPLSDVHDVMSVYPFQSTLPLKINGQENTSYIHYKVEGEQDTKKRKWNSKSSDYNESSLSPAERNEKSRERNRQHARSSRMRKKAYVESLEQTIAALKKENAELRDTISSSQATLPLFVKAKAEAEEANVLSSGDFGTIQNVSDTDSESEPSTPTDSESEPSTPPSCAVERAYSVESLFKDAAAELTGYASEIQNHRFLQPTLPPVDFSWARLVDPTNNVWGRPGNDKYDLKTSSVALADGCIATAVANYI